MLSRFFIDRPIFATVLSLVITLTGGIALMFLPVAQYPRITPPSINVSIAYPGASAKVVAETVAAPIEQAVTGVPGMLYMSSQMGNDGSYSMSVTFDVGVNLNTALVMVQNRVTLAMPLLPSQVQSQGITIRKKNPDMLSMVNFISAIEIGTTRGAVTGYFKDEDRDRITLLDADDAEVRIDKRDITSITLYLTNGSAITGAFQNDDGETITLRDSGGVDQHIARNEIKSFGKPVHSDIFMSNYALINVRDELLRVDGVSDISIMGQRDYSIRIWLDPQKLAARNLSAMDVAAAVRTQNIQAAPGQIGQPPVGRGQAQQMPLDTLGRLADPVDFANIIIKVSPPTVSPRGMALSPGSGMGDMSPVSQPTTATMGQMGGMGRIRYPYYSPSIGIVRLKDVARVEIGAKNYMQACTFDGSPSVGISVYQLPGTNALDVADRVRAKMKKLKERFPPGLTYKIVYDTTPFIRESIADVFKTLRDAVILVAIVVLLFLQDWRAMILPLIDVPVSLIGTFAVMALMGFSLNNISLFGLVLAIGIVVDDAIVVLENIERQMAKGLDARTATIKAMEEITGPILGITLVLCAVFVPCAFIPGITGRFFTQFAVTIAASTIISAINALTMTPSRALLIFQSKGNHGGGHEHKREALPWWIFGLLGLVTLSWGPKLLGLPESTVAEDAAEQPLWQSWAITAMFFSPGMLAGLVLGWFIIAPVNAVLGAFFRAFNRGFDKMTAGYGWATGRALHLSGVVLLFYAGLLVLTFWLFQRAPSGFVPAQDQGRLTISVQLPDSASLQRSREALAQVEKIVRAVPGVGHTIGIAGMSVVEQANGSNFGSLFVILDPFEKRHGPELRAEAIMERLREETKQIKDAKVSMSGTSPIPGLSVAGGFKLMIEDSGGSLDLPDLQKLTDDFIKKLTEEQREQLKDVRTQFRSTTPQLKLDIDRTKVAALGLSLDEVNQTLGMYLGSQNINRFNDFGRQWQVTIQADDQFRARKEDVNLLQVRNDKGQMVSLGTVVNVSEVNGPLFVRRYNLYTAAPINGNLRPGVSSGDVIKDVNASSLKNLPPSVKTDWTDLMFMQIREGKTAGIVFALAVLCVFLALAALYESWTLPLAVILVVPLCILCAVLGVLLVRALDIYPNMSVDVFVQIGLVVLVGLACKNAILVVEFAKQLHQEGRSIYEATLEAAKLRLRPILMTSFAFIFGVVPLCLATGAGAEMRQSLGTAVFSGMLGVTLFGIFLTPVFFHVIQGVGETPLFSSYAFQLVGSSLAGALLGALSGYLLAELDLVPRYWAMGVGAGVGIVGVLMVRVRTQIWPWGKGS